jgi:hypothetical protein
MRYMGSNQTHAHGVGGIMIYMYLIVFMCLQGENP